MRASDLTGTKGEDSEFGKLVVRGYPDIEGAKVLDVLPSEVSGLKTQGDLVELEYTAPGESTPQSLVVKRVEFDKLTTDMTATLKAARGMRGRPSKHNGS